MRLLALLLALAAAGPLAAQTKPLRVLLVTGGCCHDYATQRKLLEDGIEARANVEIVHAFNPSKATSARFEIYDQPDWFKGFDVVIHNECSADVKDKDYVNRILEAHRQGVPAVNLHCAMHSYRWGNYGQPVKPGADNAPWFEFLGLQTTGHGPQEPIEVIFTAPHPVTAGLQPWTTGKEELYNNVSIPGGKPIISGRQTVKGKTSELVMGWTNSYGPKQTRVFGLTLGHNNETVGDARYLDLVARAVLWSAGKLADDGKPLPGYGPAGR